MTAPAIITHGGTDRRHRLCRCSRCGRVETCTPARDFYESPSESPNAPLLCEDCFAAKLHDQGVVAVIDCTQPRGQA